ncbi:unnamed protein product [Pleuronectes platessa]|uniref:Uncharacterized protein n=1 Tax=Pleuronectes platessa TaxID=8262 RepID=A0A9N7V8B2_PLEPL|nr:unnamed protein product [Pleuronectes platessa]
MTWRPTTQPPAATAVPINFISRQPHSADNILKGSSGTSCQGGETLRSDDKAAHKQGSRFWLICSHFAKKPALHKVTFKPSPTTSSRLIPANDPLQPCPHIPVVRYPIKSSHAENLWHNQVPQCLAVWAKLSGQGQRSSRRAQQTLQQEDDLITTLWIHKNKKNINKSDLETSERLGAFSALL